MELGVYLRLKIYVRVVVDNVDMQISNFEYLRENAEACKNLCCLFIWGPGRVF